MKGVNFIHVSEIEKGVYSNTQIQVGIKGRWVSARPVGYKSLKHRVIAAWLVFSGQADVLYFEGDQ